MAELLVVVFGAEVGSSLADNACGTRVVVSVEDAP